MLAVAIVSVFPEMFKALESGITGRALQQGLLALHHCNPRDFTINKHRTVDDKPYGGGPGMVMKFQPMYDATKAAKQMINAQARVIYLSPQGRTLDQQGVRTLILSHRHLVLVAGRYEGIDERLRQTIIDEEISIGDYVLSGGELAAMVLIDAMVRLLPGALGDAQSAQQDSFTQNLLDHPHYTRPEAVMGLRVPDVLISGDHQAIQRWRMQQALGRTWLRRPDLLQCYQLTGEQQQLLDEFIRDYEGGVI